MSDAVVQSNTPINPRFSKRGGWIAAGIAVVVVLGGAWALLQSAAPDAVLPPADLYTVHTVPRAANTISTTGTVAADSQVSLAFQNVSGTMKSLDVRVGEQVRAGQVIATLNNATLLAQVQQAKAGVAQAQGALAQARGQLAQARGALTQARGQVAQAKGALAQTKGQQAVTEGQQAEAQAQYGVVTEGATAQNIAVARAAVASAKTALVNAQKQYQVQLASYNDRTAQQEQLVQAQNAVAQAKTALATAQQNQPGAIAAAQSALETGKNNLTVDQQNLVTDQQQYGNITLAQVQQEYAAYQDTLDSYNAWQKGGFAGENPYGVTLQTDETVYQSDSQGYYTLQGEQQKIKGDNTAIAAAQSQLTAAQSAVAQAQTNYDSAQSAEQVAQLAYNDRTQQQQALTSAANAVKQAQAAELQAESQLQQVEQPATSSQVIAAKTAIQTASAGVQAASGGVQAETAAVQTATGGVQAATAAMQTATAGIEAATAGVQAAEAQLKTAQVNEAYSVLQAPVSGTIIAKNNSVGDLIEPGQPVLEMDVAQLQVELAVSDTQLPFVKVGSPITMTVAALPGKVFAGQVFEIDPTPIPGNGTEYRVKATIRASGTVLRPGMSGNVTLVAAAAPGAQANSSLIIPATSLQQVNGVYGVYVLGQKPGSTSASSSANQGAPATANLPNGAYFRPVQIGLWGTRYVQVTRGLENGEKILLGAGRFVSANSHND